MKPSAEAPARHPAVRFMREWWDEALCALVLLMLALFLLGHDLFGLNGYVATVLALVGGVVVAVVGFVLATMVMPLVGLVVGFVGSLFAVVLAPLLTFVVGSVVVPVVAFATGVLSSALAWFAGTWLGTLLAPVINMAAPLVLKFGPWVAAAKNSEWAWRKVNQLRTQLGYEKLTVEGKVYAPRKVATKKRTSSTPARAGKSHARRR